MDVHLPEGPSNYIEAVFVMNTQQMAALLLYSSLLKSCRDPSCEHVHADVLYYRRYRPGKRQKCHVLYANIVRAIHCPNR